MSGNVSSGELVCSPSKMNFEKLQASDLENKSEIIELTAVVTKLLIKVSRLSEEVSVLKKNAVIPEPTPRPVTHRSVMGSISYQIPVFSDDSDIRDWVTKIDSLLALNVIEAHDAGNYFLLYSSGIALTWARNKFAPPQSKDWSVIRPLLLSRFCSTDVISNRISDLQNTECVISDPSSPVPSIKDVLDYRDRFQDNVAAISEILPCHLPSRFELVTFAIQAFPCWRERLCMFWTSNQDSSPLDVIDEAVKLSHVAMLTEKMRKNSDHRGLHDTPNTDHPRGVSTANIPKTSTSSRFSSYHRGSTDTPSDSGPSNFNIECEDLQIGKEDHTRSSRHCTCREEHAQSSRRFHNYRGRKRHS